jgi:hypothetical protein
MRRFILITALLTLASHSSGHAEDGIELDGLAVLQAFSGKTIQGNYADGMQFAETYHPGGRETVPVLRSSRLAAIAIKCMCAKTKMAHPAR